MCHSSRLPRILAILVLVSPAALVDSVRGQGRTVGGARTLSPIQPVVGFRRGLSPVRPVVGFSRHPSPVEAGSERPGRIAIGATRHPFRERGATRDLAGLDGFGLAGGGFGYPDVGAREFGYPAADIDRSVADAPNVLLAPPPCVHPRIISLGGSPRVERRERERPGVHVLYGRAPCGFDRSY